jgi:hypothetical protein
VTDGDDDAMIVWLQDAVASTTDTVWGNIWDGSTWLGLQQLSTSTGATAVSTLAIGHAQNRMIVGWWEANTTIVADYFDPSADTWNTGTITLRSQGPADPRRPERCGRHHSLVGKGRDDDSPSWFDRWHERTRESVLGLQRDGQCVQFKCCHARQRNGRRDGVRR